MDQTELQAEMAALRLLLMAMLVDQAKSQPGQVREARAALSALSAGLGGEIDELEERTLRRALAMLDQALELAARPPDGQPSPN